MELLDVVLEKSFLHSTLNSLANQKDEDAIKTLASVEYCWFQRIIRRRFKKRIWQRLKGFYEESKKIPAIVRNNRNYFLENIQPTDELIDSLLSLNCITEVQSQNIKRQCSKRDKNAELLSDMKSFDESTFPNFAKCLHKTNQKSVTKIFENGGVVIKLKVKSCGSACIDPHVLHQEIQELRKQTNQMSHQINKLVSRLLGEDVEIINSQLKRETVVVWIWCRSQSALQYIQKLYESNHLIDVFMCLGNVSQSTSEVMKSKVIKIDCNQFNKTVVACRISVIFTERIEVGRSEVLCGVTKLRNEIYALCRPYSAAPHLIRIFENLNPFRLRKKIRMTTIKNPFDIGSSEKENCVYISDFDEKCVWKITADKYKIIKWLTIDFKPSTLSVTSEGQLLLTSESASILRIYDSKAELIYSIQLRGDIKSPIHAVETSNGNFVILHRWKDIDESGESRSIAKMRKAKWGICVLTRDGQMVISRFIPSNKTEKLDDPKYLSVDSDDRVFLADYTNRRVILLQANLKWNRILCPTNNENILPWRLCYDQEKKELLVGGRDLYLGDGVRIYTLSRE